MSEKWIETSAGRLFSRRWEAPGENGLAPFLLFHDSLGCVDLWRDFPERLALQTGRSVIAYDRLGFGRSDPNSATLGLDFTRDEARIAVPALVAQWGLGRFVPLGHSVGGAMAVATAGAFPGCPAVITESAQAFVEDRTLAGIVAAKEGFADPAQLDRLARYHGDKARFVLDAWTETWIAPAFADWHLDADLARVRCPLLAIHGDRDEYGSLAHPERIARGPLLPGHVTVIADCGHVPHREKPDAVIAAIVDFLESVQPGRPG